MIKLKFAIICFSLFTLSLCAQNGIINSYYPNKNLRESKSFVNGVLEGTSYWFYENGNIKEEKTYSSGRLHGIVRYYYDSGLVKEEINVKNGVRHGQYKSYYENGALKEIREYDMGKLVRKNELSYDENYNPPLEAYLGNRQDEIRRNRDHFICQVDVCPKPAGGIQDIQKNLVYPEHAKLYGLEGKVKVLATIDERGKVIATEIIKELGLGCEQAAIDAVMKTVFLPGFDKGKPVVAQVSFDVEFKLTESERNAAIQTPPLISMNDHANKTIDPTNPNEIGSKNDMPNTKETVPVANTSKSLKNFECEVETCPAPVGGLQAILDNLIIPERVKRLQLQGDVVVDALVDEFGIVLDTKVISGIGYGADDAVEVAILNTVFKPGMDNGKEISTHVKIIVPIITKEN